ncbi:hypothetical protein [Aliamphritea ceti]|uniref:hypothetical protein n=1 Tax=Aliamphritea ceti TaxID=1524258 RepID=UPI0021C47858|nr:hypothetical protein [Aliamphritea ceti]
MQLIMKNNEAADAEIMEAIEAFQGVAAGGINIMGLAMNPTKAMEQFGAPLMQLVSGLQAKNEIVNDLLSQVANLQATVEELAHGE